MHYVNTPANHLPETYWGNVIPKGLGMFMMKQSAGYTKEKCYSLFVLCGKFERGFRNKKAKVKLTDEHMLNLNSFFSRIMSIEPIQRQSIVSLIWQITFTFIGFLSTMYLTRAAGAGALGAYFIFVASFNIIALMTDGGFGTAAMKRISEGEEPDAYFSAFAVLRSVFVTVVLMALFIFRSYFVDLNRTGMFIWLLVALVISLLYGTVLNGIGGHGKIGIYATAGFINNVSCTLGQVIFVFLGYGVAGLAGGFVGGMLVGSIVLLHFIDLRFVRFGWNHLKSLSSFSIWSFLLSGGEMVFLYSDTLMIGHFLSDANVGIYRVILQFTLFASFAPFALRSALWPKVSRWDKTGERELIEESLSRALTYSFLLAVPLFVGAALLGDRLLYFFYGADFVSYMTLIILFLVQIVNIFLYFFASYLSAMDQLRDLFKITTVAVAANIGLNMLLIPVIGISGSAVATLASMTLNAVLARRVLARIITIKVERSSLLNICKASITMGAVVGIYRFVVPLSSVWLVLVPVVLGGVIYGALMLKLDRKIYEEMKGIVTTMNVEGPE